MLMRWTSRRLASTIVMLVAFCGYSFGQNGSPEAPQRGSITGTVTADQGQVRGFRVTAHNLQYQLWYTVFTNKGTYTIPQALPGLYDVTVLEEEYSSPTLAIRLEPGKKETLDFAVKKRTMAQPTTRGRVEGADAPDFVGTAAKTIWVDSMDELFPPGPGRDLVKANCTGCHGANFGVMHRTREEYRAGIAKMTEIGPGSIGNPYEINLGRTPLTAQQKEQIAVYMATNFGVGTPDKKIRVEPLVVDEEAVSKTIYVSYDPPPNMAPFAPMGKVIGADMVDGVVRDAPGAAGRRLHDPFISPTDGTIWYAETGGNAMVQLDPKQLDPAKRWKVYPLKGVPYVFLHGITVDSKGHVYWAEIRGGMLGELDPKTGRQIRHTVPMPGAMLQVVTDKDDNVWFTNYLGGTFGKLDAKTRQIHMYASPTPDNGLYGLAADQQGNVWGAGWIKGTVAKWDKATESVIDYKVPNSWGMIRRVGVDSKGIVWGSEYHVGTLAALDPATGEITEYKMPLQGSSPYDAWADNSDNIWTADSSHGSLVKLDPRTKKWTYYPETQLHQGVPKVEVERNNTIWYGSRGVPHLTANHFYPEGYTANAPPLP